MKPRHLALAMALGVALWHGSAASAASDEPCDPSALPKQADALPQWRALWTACLDQPEWLAAYGAVELQHGQPAQALVVLERAVMLQPQLLGARVDMAIALAQMGEVAAAQSLLLTLAQRADLPAALRQRLQPWTTWAMGAPHIQASIGVAWASNRNAAPAADAIALTLPQQTVVVPLTLRPSPGWLWQAGVQTQLGPQQQMRADIRRAPDGRWSQERFLWRYTPPSSPDATEPLQAWVLEHQRWLGQGLYTQASIHSLQPRAWQWQVGVRHWHTDSQLDTLRTGVAWQSSVRNENTIAAGEVLLDLPLHSRPGGGRLGLGGQWAHRWNGGGPGQHHLGVQIAGWWDTQGYSPLLEAGRRRRTSEVTLQYRWTLPLAERWTLHVQAVHEQQLSNLSLFRSRNTTVVLQLRTTW